MATHSRLAGSSLCRRQTAGVLALTRRGTARSQPAIAKREMNEFSDNKTTDRNSDRSRR
jgi:hypothetical protein